MTAAQVGTPTLLGNLVAGERRAAKDPADGPGSSPIVDPATGRVIAYAPRSRQSEVDEAVGAAVRAGDEWRRTPPAERSSALLRLAQAMEDDAAAAVELECANTGKPVELTRTEEVLPAIDQLRFFAGEARNLEGRASAEYLRGHTSMLRREPVGVCAQIVPWNYPLMMSVWKAAPALAAGNTVVLKPAESTPLTALWFAGLAARHLPAGALNVLCGDRDTGALLAGHDDVDLVALTGSTRAGRAVAGVAGPRLRRLHLELGGNAPVVVFDDCDLHDAVQQIAEAAYFNAGQDCVAATRVLVQRTRFAVFRDLFTARVRRLRTGPPSDPDAAYGPLNNADQLARVEGFIARLPRTAHVATGGHKVGEEGYFYAPTVVTGVQQTDEIVQEEVFGPVVTVQSFDTPDEALRLANGVRQGLAASVWTGDLRLANRFARDLDVGCVWINTHLRFPAEMPHGGVKDSGYGKDLSTYALHEYTRVKHVMTAH
jgi:betaine-aldehyde dehydrogenase